MRLRGGSALRRTSDLAAEREQAGVDDQGSERNGQAAGAVVVRRRLLQGHGQPWAVLVKDGAAISRSIAGRSPGDEPGSGDSILLS